mmetsp:Transcript_29155/g.68082  ORF Transcript_29155/g.68082 Transcript_29155/m.68082 type:complete len:316 (-) Transcript_29155:69-1016(-)
MPRHHHRRPCIRTTTPTTTTTPTLPKLPLSRSRCATRWNGFNKPRRRRHRRPAPFPIPSDALSSTFTNSVAASRPGCPCRPLPRRWNRRPRCGSCLKRQRQRRPMTRHIRKRRSGWTLPLSNGPFGACRIPRRRKKKTRKGQVPQVKAKRRIRAVRTTANRKKTKKYQRKTKRIHQCDDPCLAVLLHLGPLLGRQQRRQLVLKMRGKTKRKKSHKQRWNLKKKISQNLHKSNRNTFDPRNDSARSERQPWWPIKSGRRNRNKRNNPLSKTKTTRFKSRQQQWPGLHRAVVATIKMATTTSCCRRRQTRTTMRTIA